MTSEDTREIYSFIVENSHYTMNRGAGMGMDIAIAPDMIKLKIRADDKKIDINRYESYCNKFVNMQGKVERRKE